MDTLFKIIMVVQVLSAILIIGLVLLQHGKGADMGAAFGSGASGSLFGATGSSNFVSKSTGVAAAVFFACTLALSYIATNRHIGGGKTGGSVMDSLPVNKLPASAASKLPVPAASAPSASATASSGTPASAGAASAPAASAPAASASAGAASAASAAAPTNQVPK
jgi:preprotein translocase subunit SecG